MRFPFYRWSGFGRRNGRPLSPEEVRLYQYWFTREVLECTRVVEGKVPFWLRRTMDGIVLGSCIYFRRGAYRANSLSGIELLAHELTHVEQFCNGMTVPEYLWESRHGYLKNRYEIEACAKAAMIRSMVTI